MHEGAFPGTTDSILVRSTRYVYALLLAVSLAACGDDDGNTGPATIRLAQNAWLGSELNATVAQILLEEQLGFAAEIYAINEDAQWDLVAVGETPPYSCIV